MMSESVFEVVTLVSVALGATLLLCVSQRTMQAPDALRIHMLLGSFMSSLLYFYVPHVQAARYWLAIAGIPLTSHVYAWLFSGTPAAAHHLGQNKAHAP